MEKPLFIETRDLLIKIEHMLQSGVMHQTILIHGHSGIGKSLASIEIAKLLLLGAMDYTIIDDSKFVHIDFMHISSKYDTLNVVSHTIGIDEVRLMQAFASKSTAGGKCKVILIDCIDDVSYAAANALLKLSEEPPMGVYLICVARSASAIPATIRSRCLKIHMQRPHLEEFIQVIQSNIVITDEVKTLQTNTLQQFFTCLYDIFSCDINMSINFCKIVFNDINCVSVNDFLKVLDLFAMGSNSFDIRALMLLCEKHINCDMFFDVIVKLCMFLLSSHIKKDSMKNKECNFIRKQMHAISLWEDVAQLNLKAKKYNLNKNNVLLPIMNGVATIMTH